MFRRVTHAVVSRENAQRLRGMTTVQRSLASAVSPPFAGYMLSVSTFGWPLVRAGVLKLTYDVLLLTLFKNIAAGRSRGLAIS